MAKKKEDEKFELWKSRITVMKRYMKNAAMKNKWDELKNYYKGDYKKALKLKIAVVVVNMVKAFVDTAVADLFARNPKFKANPTKQDSILKAKVSELAINYQWYVLKLKRQVKKCIKQGKLLGYSWIKVGYNAETEGYEENEYVKSEEIYAIHIDNDAIWFDPEAKDPPYDCCWMIHNYMKPIDKLKEKYGDKLKIESTEEVSYDKTKQKDNTLKPKDKEFTMVHEIWDRENDEILIMCDGYKEGFLEERTWEYDKKMGFPFALLSFDTGIEMDEDNNLPRPEILGFEDQILEKIKLRSMTMDHLKRFSRQMLAKKGALDESNMAKYNQGIDGAVIEAETEGGPLANVLQPISYPALQPEIYQVEGRIDMDFDIISGQTGMKRGASVATKTRTLGEIQEISAGSASRSDEHQDIVEEFTEEVAKKMLILMGQYYTSDKYARIIGDVGPLEKQLFEKNNLLDGGAIKYNGELLKGDYDLQIVAGSTLPMNPSNRLNNLLAVAKFGQVFGLTPGSISSMYLGKSIMEELELRDVVAAFEKQVEEAMKPKEPTMQEKMKMISEKQKIDNKAADTKLKQTRIEANTLSNVGKALKNATDMEGEQSSEM